MLEVLQFYVSGFWSWAGITFGIAVWLQIIFTFLAALVQEVRR